MWPLLLRTLCCLLLIEGALRIPGLADHFEQIKFNEVALKNVALFHAHDERQTPPSVLMFGTSRTRVAFIPRVFDAELHVSGRSFNLGVSSGPILVHRLWLEQFIRQYGRPRLVLLEIPVFSLNRQFRDDTIHYYRTVGEDRPLAFVAGVVSSPVSRVLKVEILLASFLNVYRYRGYLGLLTMQKAWKAPRSPHNDWTYQDGWFPDNVSLAEEQRAAQVADYRHRILARYEVDLAESRAFLSYARAQDIPVVLVQWPITSTLQDLHDELRVYSPYLAAMRQLQDAYAVPFLNLHDTYPDVRDKPEFFLDIHHMSQKGAEAFTKHLAVALKTEASALVSALSRGNREKEGQAPR